MNKNENKTLQAMEALGWFIVAVALLVLVLLTVQAGVVG